MDSCLATAPRGTPPAAECVSGAIDYSQLLTNYNEEPEPSFGLKTVHKEVDIHVQTP